MSTKPKRKLEKLKTKKFKRAPIKQNYTEEEINELKNKYNDIMFHLSSFLQEHTVYEAVPENAKLLVFSSELSFYEMIRVFIFEDIYCGLIYDPKLNNYLGLITTRDLMILYKYIITNYHSEEITDFNIYLKDIFSKKLLDKINENNSENLNNINNDINIFEYLSNINYLDYLVYAKKTDFHNIHILSVSLDDNLYETLEKINIKNIHRLLVEDDNKKNHHQDLQYCKQNEIIEKNEQSQNKVNAEINNKQRNSMTEKTTTTNCSDEDNKNNSMLNKKDIKKMEEKNELKIEEEPKEEQKEESKEESKEQPKEEKKNEEKQIEKIKEEKKSEEKQKEEVKEEKKNEVLKEENKKEKKEKEE